MGDLVDFRKLKKQSQTNIEEPLPPMPDEGLMAIAMGIIYGDITEIVGIVTTKDKSYIATNSTNKGITINEFKKLFKSRLDKVGDKINDKEE